MSQCSVFRSQYSDVKIHKKSRFDLLMAVLLAWVFAGVRAWAGDVPLAELDARFTPVETPVFMEYDVGYRLLNIELSRVGKVVASTTIGRWRHRVTGHDVPALFLDMQVDSPDRGKAGRRNRVSIHDRIVAVMTLPDMQALVFAKYTDEYLHPLIGRCKETLACSIYDTQSGRLEYTHRELKDGSVSTNLVNPEALLELSRKIRPVMDFLVGQYKAPTLDAATSGKGLIVANLDGHVVVLRMLTSRERSPACLARKRMDSMCINPVAERGSSVKPRDFHAWSMTFEKLAMTLNDEALIQSAHHAPVETVVPLAIDYELGLGSVRATMTSIRLGKVAGPSRVLVVTKGPESVGQK